MKKYIKSAIRPDVDAKVQKYADSGKFTQQQLMEIWYGFGSNVDATIYADPKFSWKQMRMIWEGLKKGLDVSWYTDPIYDPSQMHQIRLGLLNGVDVSWYADPKFNYEQMYEIREGLEKGLDVSEYADPKYDADQMKKIRRKLKADTGNSNRAAKKKEVMDSFLESESYNWDIYNLGRGQYGWFDDSNRGMRFIDEKDVDWDEVLNEDNEDEILDIMLDFVKTIPLGKAIKLLQKSGNTEAADMAIDWLNEEW